MKGTVLAFALLIGAAAATVPDAALAQEPSPAAELSVGWVGFPDDGVLVSEALIGGTARWYVRPRLSVGPELVYVNGRDHAHLMLTGNLTWDFLAPVNGDARPVTPFVTVGAGLFQTRQTIFGGTFTSREGACTAGGGIRAVIAERVSVGVEARAGWETHLRLNGFIGVRLGKSR